MALINELLKKDEWVWGDAQETAFRQVKDVIYLPSVLAYYDPLKETVIQSDASSYGIGRVILQKHDDVLRPVAFALRTLTATEARYAQIEKELLAAVWCCEKFDKYLIGLNSSITQTDHKPLIPIINNKDVDTAPICCQRLLLRLMRYNATAIFIPGKLPVVTDALSRKPMHGETSMTEGEFEAYVNTVSQSQPASDQHLEKIRQATEEDNTLQLVAKYTLTGWPRRSSDVIPEARPYYHVRHELSMANGMLLRDTRVVLPHVMRPDVLSETIMATRE